MSFKKIERTPVNEPASRSAGLYPVQSAGYRQPAPFWQAVDMDAVTGVINNASSGASRLAGVVEKINNEADQVAIGQMQTAMKTAWDEGHDEFLQHEPNDQLYNSIESRVESFKLKMFAQLDSLPLSRAGKEEMTKALELSSQQVKFGYESAFRRKKVEWTNKGTMQFLNQAATAGDVSGVNQWYDKAESLGIMPEKTREAMISYAASRAMMTGYEQMPLNQLRTFINENQDRLAKTGDNTIKIGENSVFRDDLREVISKAKRREDGLISDNVDAYNRAYVDGQLTMAALKSDYDYGLVDEKTFQVMEKNLQRTRFILMSSDLQRNGDNAEWRKGAITSIDEARKVDELSEDQATHLRALIDAKDESSRKMAEEAIRRQEAERKKKADNTAADFKIKHLDFEWSIDAVARKQQYTDEKLKLNFDNTLTLEEKAPLLERLKRDYETGFAYKQRPNYQYGDSLIKQMQAQGKFFAQKPGVIWGTNADKEKPVTAYVEDLVRIGLDDFLRANPEANESQVKAKIDEMTTLYNSTLVDQLADKAFQTSTMIRGVPAEKTAVAAAPGKQELRKGDVINGKRFRGGDPKDRANWEDIGMIMNQSGISVGM